MGAAVRCESYLLGQYSMRDLSEDSNSCSWSVHRGDVLFPSSQHQIGSSSSARPVADSCSDYGRDFVKRTMLEQEAVFKNQVFELHRVYRVQRTLMEELRQKKLNENPNQSPEIESTKQRMPAFLSGSSECGGPSVLGSSSHARSGHIQNGVGSNELEAVKVRPMKLRRKMIDLQLPAEEYMDTDEIGDPRENPPCPPFERSILGKEAREKQFLEDSSGSCLGLMKFNGFADLNEPVHCLDQEFVASSKDVFSLCGRNDVHVQGHCLERDTSRNGWMVLEAGRDESNQTEKVRLPFHQPQNLSNNAFQRPIYPSSEYGMAKFSGERTFCDLEARMRNPEVSYNSRVEPSVLSSHGHRAEFVQPWSHWLSSRDNLGGISSGQKFMPVQANPPFLNCATQGRANPSFEVWCRDFNGLHQGSSSAGSKEAVFGFPQGSSNLFNNRSNGAISNGPFSAAVKLESLQGPKRQEECSSGLSWLQPKPRHRSEMTNGCFDLNASLHQFTDETEMGKNGFSDVTPAHKSLRSASCSIDAGIGRVEPIDMNSSGKILGFPVFEKRSIVKEEPSFTASPSISITGRPVDENKSVRRGLDINVPCDAAVSVTDHRSDEVTAFVDKEEGERAVGFRHDIDLNICACEDEDSGGPSTWRVKRKAIPWIDLEAPAALDSEDEAEKSPEKTNEDPCGLRKGEDGSFEDELKAAAEAIVAISISSRDRPCHPDETAASSSSDGPLKDPLSWFADTIASRGGELEKHVEAFSEGRHCEGGREECSSGEFDYFEAMTLNLVETKEEDYMPKPVVPESLNLDGTGSATAIPNRPRRGQPRRGRPKRDFQRDILPGLTSLARHEVAEDLHMFGGLLKTTGCSWNPGAARRNPARGGSNRGRKRLVTNINRAPSCPSSMQPTNENDVQVAGPEDRSLTGWGRATRRPRRQRCPAGNPPTVILT